MKKSSLNIFELHVEKILLGLAGAFVLAMVWMYGINSPNKVDYEGQTLGPGGLEEAIGTSARDLARKVGSAKVEVEPVPKFSDRLLKEQQGGVLTDASGAAVLPGELRLAGAFGKPIEVKGLEDDEETGKVTLVTPLRPSRPALRTGRSMAVVRAATLASAAPSTASPAAPPAGGESSAAAEPVELPWVSVAAFIDRKAQQNEMTKSGYAPYRSKVYVVGLEVQRQEMRSSGDWSEWKDAPASKAMPQFDVPTPLFDSDSGAMLNKTELDQAFTTVQAQQAALMQPGFYEIKAGDDWAPPPLPGFEDQPEEAAEETPRPRGEERPTERHSQPQIQERTGREGAGEGGSRGPGGGPGGGLGGPGSRQPNPRNERAEGARQGGEDLAAARKASKAKDYAAARDSASRVISNQYAKSNDKRAAERILASAEKELNKSARPSPDRDVSGFGRVGGRTGGSGTPESATPLLTSPDDPNLVPVWFHDDAVEAGKTYRYRLRFKLWNRYVARPRALTDSAGANQSVLLGEWSLPSDPITVAPASYFFVRSARQNKASLDVFKWREGRWLKESFDVEVGDTIGGLRKVKLDEDDDGKPIKEDVDFSTGAVVLDVREEPIKVRLAAGKKGEFRYNPQPSLIVTYLDPADGQVKERIQALDRNDPIKKKLESDAG